jgi:hypothetical protein
MVCLLGFRLLEKEYWNSLAGAISAQAIRGQSLSACFLIGVAGGEWGIRTPT